MSLILRIGPRTRLGLIETTTHLRIQNANAPHNALPYSLVLSQQLPHPSLLSVAINVRSNETDNHSTHSMQNFLRKLIAALRVKVHSKVRQSQLTYKLNHDRHIRKTSTSSLGLYFIVDIPNLRTVPNASAKVMTGSTHNKLQALTNCSHQMISAPNSTIKIDDNGNPPTVSIGHVTHASPSLFQKPDHPHGCLRQRSVQTP